MRILPTPPGLGRFVCGKLLALLAVLSVLVAGRWIAFSVQDFGTANPGARSTGHDAPWLGHAWVDGHRTEADVARLAARLHATDVTDLFVHVGPLEGDGTLDPAKAPGARWFAAEVHALIPSVRLQAWIGDEIRPSGGMNIESSTTRARIVSAARQALARGFDGVHLDLEPDGDADPGDLDLLDALRLAVHGAGGVLSVSAEQVEPLRGSRWAMEALEGHSSWRSRGFLRHVASRVDQVALMTYDTALWTPGAYTGFVRDETALALTTVPANVAVLIGLPAFHDAHSLAHASSAETVAAAIRGVQLALPAGTPLTRRIGVALVSAQRTSTTVLLAGVAAQRGLAVHELTGPAALEALAGHDVYWYGGPRAALRAVRELRIGLLEPLDAWLTLLPHRFVGRGIALATLAEAWQLTRPAFVKPPREKSLPAAVYADGSRLPRAGGDLGPDTPVLISEVVTFTVEYRLFILDQEIVTGSRYAVHGHLEDAWNARSTHPQLPREAARRLGIRRQSFPPTRNWRPPYRRRLVRSTRLRAATW